MNKKTTENKFSYFVSILALIFLLLGLYSSVRTALNLYLFEKYPSGGVLSFNSWYGEREEDCAYPMQYFDMKGEVRPASADEEKMATEQKEICLTRVEKTREAAKVNDVSVSLFYLFLGVGIFVGKKFIKSWSHKLSGRKKPRFL